MAAHLEAGTWTNWAGTASATPARIARPRDVTEIASALRDAEKAGLRVRPMGSGHSFTAIAACTGLAIDLSGWTGVVAADRATGLVTVRAGTTLKQLNAELDRLGLAMSNLGDIDKQTISGAISTGTHGTGARLGGLSTQVRALELVLADGSVLTCSADQHPDVFAAARVGLGALGVISTVTLQCEPAFLLAAKEYPTRLDEILEQFDELTTSIDHVEFHWFAHTDGVMVKRNSRLPATAAAAPLSSARQFFEYEVLENFVFGTACRLGRAMPRLVRPINRLSSRLLSERNYSDRSHRVLTSPRRVRFVESEYAVPRECLHEVLRELRSVLSRLDHPVSFPLEVRVAAADDIWLSTAYQRESAYIAVHQFTGMPFRQWFDRFEAVVNAAGGRPHWGKLHSLDAQTLRQRYPRFADFLAVRAELDPLGRFRNDYLDRVLGPVAAG